MFTVLKNWIFYVRFEVFRAMKIRIVVFWLVTSCSLVGKSQLFGGKYRFCERLCGLVARVLGYRSGGPGSIPGTTREKK
jgi:hypothetical protein